MTDLLLILTYISFLAIGVMSPFVAALGYIWVDTFYPHYLSYGLLSSVPVSFVMGAAAFGAYILFDRRDPPRPTLGHALFFVIAVWITLTNSWAVVPAAAAPKYDGAVKCVLFSAFLPFVFRTRVQIEAFIQVLLFAAAGHILPWGIKTAVAGGGYEKSLGLLGVNSAPLAESSTISAVCFAFIPILLVLAKNNVIVPANLMRHARYGFYGMCALFAIGAIGTYARTALIGLAVMAFGLWLRAKSKVLFGVIGAMCVLVLLSFTSEAWSERVSTVKELQADNSASVRFAVWRWTWDFAVQNPLGGGFNVFYINRVELPNPVPGEAPIIDTGRAFHSIYFAVLGEHGFPGLILYLAILTLVLFGLFAARRRLRGHPEHAWCYEMCAAMQVCLVTLYACAVFTDLSFIPVLWNMLALAVCLTQYARRAVPNAKRPALAYDVSSNSRLPARVAEPSQA